MIDTGHTLSLAARTLHECGAKSIQAVISHGLLSGTNLRELNELPLDTLIVSLSSILLLRDRYSTPSQVTNSIPQNEHHEAMPKLVTIDISPTIAESIRRTHNGESISLLFGEWAETIGVQLV